MTYIAHSLSRTVWGIWLQTRIFEIHLKLRPSPKVIKYTTKFVSPCMTFYSTKSNRDQCVTVPWKSRIGSCRACDGSTWNTWGKWVSRSAMSRPSSVPFCIGSDLQSTENVWRTCDSWLGVRWPPWAVIDHFWKSARMGPMGSVLSNLQLTNSLTHRYFTFSG